MTSWKSLKLPFRNSRVRARWIRPKCADSPFVNQRYPEGVTQAIAFFAGLLLLTTSVIGGAVPAFAHAELVSTDPVDGAVLESAPESLTLNFDSSLLDGMVEVAVSNSTGEIVSGFAVESTGTRATAAWRADLPGDRYTVAYRIVSQDGHPVTGSLSFSYPDLTTVAASAVAAPEVTTMATPSAAPKALDQSALQQSTSQPASSDSGPTLVWVLGFLALVLVVAGYFIWRKRTA